MKTKILIVEDDRDLGQLLKQYLELNKFEVNRVFNGEEARYDLTKNSYDIVIIDVMMPKEDGFVLAEKISYSHPKLPFLFITARNSKEDIRFGLNLGAEDYIIKPFDAVEVILRIKNILKRNIKKEEFIFENIQIGIFTFQPRNFLLTSGETKILLTEKESQLLYFFYRHKNEVVKRDEVLAELWEEVNFFNGRSMDVFISRIRKFLLKDVSINIENIRGIGFRFNVPD